jgi:ABC-2 type transport system permease protein
MGEAIWAELLKARRSRLPWLTVLAFTVAAGVGGLFMFILQDPGRARAMGLLGAKAQLAVGTADWPAYFALLAQTVAVGGALIFGMIVIWTFGREFSDHTVKDLLALPTSRTMIVAAKYAVTAVWCVLLTTQTYLLGLVVGAALRLPGWTTGVAVQALAHMMVIAVLAVLLTTALRLAASVGRGYLAAIGVMFVTLFLAQVIAVLGYGHLFPWSVPAVYSEVGGPDHPSVGPVGYALVVVVAIVSVTATATWWRTADHTQ